MKDYENYDVIKIEHISDLDDIIEQNYDNEETQKYLRECITGTGTYHYYPEGRSLIKVKS